MKCGFLLNISIYACNFQLCGIIVWLSPIGEKTLEFIKPFIWSHHIFPKTTWSFQGLIEQGTQFIFYWQGIDYALTYLGTNLHEYTIHIIHNNNLHSGQILK